MNKKIIFSKIVRTQSDDDGKFDYQTLKVELSMTQTGVNVNGSEIQSLDPIYLMLQHVRKLSRAGYRIEVQA